MVTIDAILLGGGNGRRYADSALSAAVPKQFLLLGGLPVWIHSLKALVAMECVRRVVFAVPPDFVAVAERQLVEHLPGCPLPLKIIVGGERRQDSSRNALEALELTSPPPTRVLIHDACRPYLSSDLIDRLKNATFDRSYGAWIPVVPVIETLKKIENHQVMETVERAGVQRVQTPQIFEFNVIRSLVEKTRSLTDINFTDDASLCEYYGIPVGTFAGDVRNIKLTYDFEMDALVALLERRKLEHSGEQVICESESASTFTV